MMKNFIAVALTLVACLIHPVAAQDKSLLLTDIMNRKLYPASLVNLQWRNNTLFTWNANNCIVQGNIASPARDTILKLEKLNAALSSAGLIELKAMPVGIWENDRQLSFIAQANFVKYDVVKGSADIVNTFDTDAENVDVEHTTGNIAYTKKNNLYISVGGSEIAITNDADMGIVNGKTVHRNEFGINGGTFWSPKGNLLAFYRMDETMVTQYPIVGIDNRVAEVQYIRYPMAGMASHQVTVGVYDISGNKLIFLKTGEPAEQYLTNITWSPDEKYIFIAVLNRDQNHMWLNQYDAASGSFIQTLFDETDEEYVEPLHKPYFIKNKPGQFIWQSRRDGFNHLYLYDSNGKCIKQLTKGTWEVTDFAGVDPEFRKIYYTSTQENPLERHFYSLDLKTGKIQRITSQAGTHLVTMSPGFNYFIDRYSHTGIALRIALLGDKGNEIQQLAEDKNPLKDYKTGKTTLITLKAKDGSDLYGRLITPVGFDSLKKYPAIVYVYGGPHSQLVTNSWLAGAGMYLNYLASQGYVVWTLDNRGTANRGAGFEQVIHRRLGDVESEDQMTGVEYLKSLPIVDAARMAIDGWSYGGFMTLTIILRNPGVFKVATCGGPVIDWKYYEVMYGERYMDTPEQNPEGYTKSSILNYVDQLQGKLLVIHGAQDETVVWQHSLQFIKKCIELGKQVDYFVYPQHEHNVTGKDRLHLFRKLTEYYNANL